MSDDNKIKRHFGANNTKYDATVVSHKSEVVEVDLENSESREARLKQLWSALNGLKKHNKSEVNRIIEVVEKWSKSQLKSSGSRLEGIELSLEHDDVEVRLAWFATKLLSNVDDLREALKNEETWEAAFYSMDLMGKVGELLIMGVEHPTSFGLEAFKRAREQRDYFDKDKREWEATAERLLVEHEQSMGNLLSTDKIVVELLIEAGFTGDKSEEDTPRSAMTKHINEWRRGTEWKKVRGKKSKNKH